MVSSIAFCRNELEEIKAILGDKPIDIYLHSRLPPNCTEAKRLEIFDLLATLQKEGHFRALGACEMNVRSLEIMSQVQPPFPLAR